MQCLDQVDAWVVCKHGLVCGIELNGTSFELTSMQTLLNTLFLSATHFLKCIMEM
jgi:hypothetical protein